MRVELTRFHQVKRTRAGGDRSPLRLFVVLAAVVCGGYGGVILFDKVLMPSVVRHGEEVRVPAVGGKELDRAIEALRQAGLEPVVAEGRPHEVVPRGVVLEVGPQVGLSVKRGRQVVLTPSIGRLSREVPDLIGLSLRMVQIRLSDAGLQLGAIDYAATNEQPPDHVLAMSPRPGTAAAENLEVSLLLSRPRAATPYWLPDFRGHSSREAVALLQRSGLRVELRDTFGEPLHGTVVAQEPAPGSPVWKNTPVRLAVGPGSPAHSEWGRG